MICGWEKPLMNHIFAFRIFRVYFNLVLTSSLQPTRQSLMIIKYFRHQNHVMFIFCRFQARVRVENYVSHVYSNNITVHVYDIITEVLLYSLKSPCRISPIIIFSVCLMTFNMFNIQFITKTFKFVCRGA